MHCIITRAKPLLFVALENFSLDGAHWRLCPCGKSLIQQTFCSPLWSVLFCRDNQQAGCFDKNRASRQNESQDIKATSAVTELVVSCITVAWGEARV